MVMATIGRRPPPFLALLLALLLAPGFFASARADVSVEVDREPVALNESVQIVFSVDGEFEGTPDFSPLEADFEILKRSQSSSISIVNGQYSSTTRWVVQAIPRKIGVLTIPPIRFGNLVSEPTTLRVETPAPGAPGQAGGDVFIEVEATPEDPYVQAEIVLTVRIFTAVRTSGARLTEPDIRGVDVVIQRTAADRPYEARRDGRAYRVTERNYSVFPQASGRLTIGPMLFSAELGSNRMLWQDPLRQGQFVRVRSQPIELDVRPIPAGFPGQVWLPARSVNIAASWSPAAPEFRAGEPATLILELTAVGLAASQLPPITLDLPDGLRQYPDQPVTEERWTGRNTVAEETLRIALIPGREGRHEIPPLSLPWWNVDTDTLEYARVEDLSFVAAPGQAPAGRMPSADTGAPSSPAAAGEASPAAAGPGPWPWISLALGAGWLLTLLVWWRGRRVAPRPAVAGADPRTAVAGVRRAARGGDPDETARALLDWGAALWPEAPPRSLRALAQRCDADTAAPIAELERSLYADGAAGWDAPALIEAVARFRRPPPSTSRPDSAGLAPLYPS
jgi:hypothetical protein